MSYTESSISAAQKQDERSSFAYWQRKNHEIADEYTLRKRKAELYALVRKVIKNELDPVQQEIVRLHWYEKKSLTEISELLGIDRSTVFRKEKKINDIIYDKLKYAIEYRFREDFSDKPFAIAPEDRIACCPVEGRSISMRLRDLRLRCGMSEKVVARETEISGWRLDKIEAEGELITVSELKKLTLLYGTTSDYVLFGRMPKYYEGGRQQYDT